MMRRSWMWVVAGLLCIAPIAGQATPIVYTVATGGIDDGYGCGTNTQCLTGVGATYHYSAPPAGYDPASGTLTLDTGANTLVIALTGVSSIFEDISGAFNGVDEVDFTSVSYTSGTLTVVPAGGGVYNVAAAQSVTVSGSYTQKLAGGTVVGSTAFSVPANISSGQCVVVGSSVTCGFDFGPGGIFQLGIGTTPQNRRFLHTINVVAVPEPGTVILLGAGIAGIALRRRSH